MLLVVSSLVRVAFGLYVGLRASIGLYVAGLQGVLVGARGMAFKVAPPSRDEKQYQPLNIRVLL